MRVPFIANPQDIWIQAAEYREFFCSAVDEIH